VKTRVFLISLETCVPEVDVSEIDCVPIASREASFRAQGCSPRQIRVINSDAILRDTRGAGLYAERKAVDAQATDRGFHIDESVQKSSVSEPRRLACTCARASLYGERRIGVDGRERAN